MKNRVANLVAAVCALGMLLQPVAAQYRNAVPGYRFQFPQDYFDHPEFQTEWWYYTGNVKSTNGRHFGFELTFFRQAVDREGVLAATWEVRDLYLAHFALSDLDEHHFYQTERLNRGGPGIAGVSLSDGRIWNGNWGIQWNNSTQQLQAIDGEFQLHLELRAEKPPVIHGENGVSQKAAESGHGSYYISLTRLAASGEIQLRNEHFTVSGLAWMDHEFFSQQLQSDQTGWDWLSIQLDDNTEIMLFRIRRRDGSFDPFSSGTYVDAQGRSIHLRASDFRLEPLREVWTSSITRATYPVGWHIAVPKLGVELDAHTKLPNQELAAEKSFVPAYWEGAMFLEGRRGSAPLNGSGYLEMTGYDRPVKLAP